MIAQIHLPAALHIGGGAIGELPNLLRRLGIQRPLVITDPAMVELGHVGRLTAILTDAGCPASVFDATEQEPSSASIDRGVAFWRNGDFDGLVALGGGSPIDSAKAIGVLAHHGGRMRDYAVPHDVEHSGIPVIAIPTTAGTGSEATRFTVITDSDSHEKMLCRGNAFLPTAAIVDYEFTLTAPARLTADTGIDALTHAIEAYVSRRASPFTDDLALAAMGHLAAHIDRVCVRADDRDARAAMMLGATQAGMAFSNASVCLVHGMSRPVGALFHVPHGLSNAMLLPAVTRFSADAAPERYARCCLAMGWCEAATPAEEAVERLVAGLIALNRRLEVPDPKAFGIERDAWFGQLEHMAMQAEASGSPANNPRIPTRAEMVALYTEVWGNA
ncbi:MAG: iron-containing alcohol dehydrogenase [Gammaproteobacteria bacterium]|nr:iron-containing alcohol dehydrogenase [Gammaproteobacteria bacterium]